MAKEVRVAPSNPADPSAYGLGGAPLVVLAGDFLQLPPFEGYKKVSLLMEPNAYMDGDEDGANAIPNKGFRMFWDGITDVVILRKTYRFVDTKKSPPEPCPFLPRLFEYMRNPQGRPMADDLWRALHGRLVRGPNDPRPSETRIRNGYRMAILWEAGPRPFCSWAALGNRLRRPEWMGGGSQRGALLQPRAYMTTSSLKLHD